MGKFETKTLPVAIRNVSTSLKGYEKDLSASCRKLDADDERREHDCDCEYCGISNLVPMSIAERNDTHRKIRMLKRLIADYRLALKRLTGYKEFIEKVGI